MPHRTSHSRHPEPRARAQSAVIGGRRSDYTFAHAGRQLRLGPIAFWVVVGTLVIMAAWTIVTATYFAFRDDVLTRLIARQAEMQFAYEDRIAEMRAQIDRVVSRQLLDQEQFEQKLEQIMRRQAALEARAALIGSLADPVVTGSVRSGARAPQPQLREAPRETPRPKPSPISDTILFTAPPDREARLESRLPPTLEGSLAARAKAGGFAGMLARLQGSLDQVEVNQSAALNAIEERFDATAHRMRSVLSDLGVKVGKPPPPRGVGGPLVAVKNSELSAFQRQLYRISLARAQVQHLTQTLQAVPVRRPISGDAELSSGFGVRIDPFLGRPAMHTGLDFRAATGDRVLATANGTVISAGWNGGYGKMVEVSHGNGFTTRYAHLSEILVSVGQRVTIGQAIGKVGSTGRSTGPHLHYETRIDDEAVDPQKFLRAGIRLSGQL
jgi:murein DD-endopeptidase MepM/ murein hydrolase activator NlpD